MPVPYSKNPIVISATVEDRIDHATERIVMVGPADEVMPRYIEMCEQGIQPISHAWRRGPLRSLRYATDRLRQPTRTMTRLRGSVLIGRGQTRRARTATAR